ncbi:MAG: prenyltransferase/squalene oxidase repeat-containing protein, partial [Opitutales bacterium]
MSLRLEMLQVARLSPELLGDSSDLVAAFIQSQQAPEGGFLDLDNKPDLYYTVFAINGLLALQKELPRETLTPYLTRFKELSNLDFVHLCCLARCLANLELAPPPDLAEALAAYRSQDGGFEAEPNQETGSVYGCYLALGAYQDIGSELPDPGGLIACVESLRTEDGAYANEAGLPMGTTPSTAAAVDILRTLDQPIDSVVGDWLLEQCHPDGGFFAMPLAPMPDLLTTATALHALSGLQRDIEAIREPCLDFIDTLWTNRGGFYGNWM